MTPAQILQAMQDATDTGAACSICASEDPELRYRLLWVRTTRLGAPEAYWALIPTDASVKEELELIEVTAATIGFAFAAVH